MPTESVSFGDFQAKLEEDELIAQVSKLIQETYVLKGVDKTGSCFEEVLSLFLTMPAEYIREKIYVAALEKALSETHTKFSDLPPEEQSWLQNLRKAGISVDDREIVKAANAFNVIFEVFVNSGSISFLFVCLKFVVSR
jgi:hypothetical protein